MPWGQAKVSETSHYARTSPRMENDGLTFGTFGICAFHGTGERALRYIKKTQSVLLCPGSHCRVWGEIWLPLGRNTREIHREKFHSNRRAPGSRPGRPTNLPPILSSSCIPKLTLKALSLPQLVFALNAELKGMAYSPS